MILDTTYLLPLAQIAVDKDLLNAVAKKKADLKLEDISVSLISLFELQAKGAKLNVPTKSIVRAVDAITSGFRVIPFYNAAVIETAGKMRKAMPDYVDCIILATAITNKEELVTEDSRILDKKRRLHEEYGLRVVNFKDLTSP